ncbi:MAG: O-antigen polymerase [candidate division WOR-3 bacterium]
MILIVGIILIWLQIRSKWPGWVGFPFLMVTIRAVHETAISPLLSQIWGQRFFQFIGEITQDELPSAIVLILLSYSSIAFGLFLVRAFSNQDPTANKAIFKGKPAPKYATQNAWISSFTLFLVGFVANVIVLGFLLQNSSLFLIARFRTPFTDEIVLTNRFYHYARLTSNLMPIGALGMFLFSKNVSVKRRSAWVAYVLYIMFETIWGGRGGVILGIIAFIIVYHYVVKRINIKNIFIVGILLFIALSYILTYRFGTTSLKGGLLLTLRGFLISGNINDAAFALRNFPTVLPFLNGGSILAGLSHFIPELPMPGAVNIWLYIVNIYFGGINPMLGIGGGNFALGAEHYMNFGYIGVIGMGILFGVIFGFIFELQRRNYENPFLLLISAQASVFFLSGIESRCAYILGGMILSTFVPIGILAAMSLPNRKLSKTLMLVIYLTFVAFIFYQSSDFLPYSYLFKYLIFLGVTMVYYLSFKRVFLIYTQK